MSSLSMEKIIQTLSAPNERVRECRGDEKGGNYTELVRYLDPEWGLVVQKKYAGNLEDLINGEVQTLQYINSRFKKNAEARRYLPYCVGTETRQLASDERQETRILMKWHGFDIQDLVYLLPPEFNLHWGNPIFVMALMAHALRALRSLHGLGIIHGDIKWDNIVLEVDLSETSLPARNRKLTLEPEKLRLIDFGISSGRLNSYEHLFGIDFNNNVSYKSPSLKEAHNQLKFNKDDSLLTRLGHSIDLYALGAIFGDHVSRYCLAGGPARQCLLDICRDLMGLDARGYIEDATGTRITNSRADRERLYASILGRIEPFLRGAPQKWEFNLPADDLLLRQGKRSADQFFTQRTQIIKPAAAAAPTVLIRPSASPGAANDDEPLLRNFAGRILIIILLAVLAGGIYETLTGGHDSPPPERGNAAETDDDPKTLFKAGKRLEKGKQYAAAAKAYRKSADQGYSEAQTALGILYVKGLGVTRSNVEAVKWYRKAAEGGDVEAQNYLAWMLSQGRGTQKDESEAAHWYQKSAQAGSPVGQYNLGRLYRDGRGVDKNTDEALIWLRKAAGQGHTEAKSAVKKLTAENTPPAATDTVAVKGKDALPKETWLQVGAFADLTPAIGLRAQLLLYGFDATIRPARLADGQTIHRVRVGPFSERSALDTMRQRLSSHGFEGVGVTD